MGRIRDTAAGGSPKIGAALDKFAVRMQPANEKYQAEYYPPWEDDNPIKGSPTVDLFGDRGDVENAALLSGEVVHYLGSADPRSGKAVDDEFYRLKDSLMQSLTPKQLEVDQSAFESAKKNGYAGDFKEFLWSSRGDEYIMGYLFPDKDDEWRKQGVYTDEQKKMLDEMGKYLQVKAPNG